MGLIKVILLFLPVIVLGQNSFQSDSLKLELNTSNSDTEKIELLIKLSEVYRTIDLKESLSYTDEAIKIAEVINDEDLVAQVFKQKGDIFSRFGIIEEALQNYLRAKTIWQNQGEISQLVSVEHNIGAVYYYQGDFNLALQYFKGALGACIELQEQGDTTFSKKLHVMYNTIGSVYDLTGDNELALTYFNKALENANKYNDYFNLGNIYNNLGKLHSELEESDKAIEYFRESLKYRQKINDKSGIIRSYLFMASHYMNNKRYDAAMSTAIKSKALLDKQSGALRSKRDLWELLHQLYKIQSKSEDALMAHEQFIIYKDSILSENSVKEITRLQMQYEYDMQEHEKTVKQQRTRLVFITSLAILGLLIVIVSLLYVLSKSRSKRMVLENQRLESDLELKNKELTTNVMYLLKKNEFLSSISLRLIDIKKKLRGDNSQTVQQLIYEIQSAVDEDVWEEFELRFQQVHEAFFEKLKMISSELTPAELKICAFLRLNLKTKEIASITHLSIRSIEVTRSNIRKKLKITNLDTNLISFLIDL